MFIGNQVRDGLAEVPKELIAGLGALYHMSRKHWQPWQRIVPAQLLELGNHVVGPVLRTGLPAIVDHVADTTISHVVPANRLLVAVEVFFEVILHKPAVKLIDLESSGFGSRGVVSDSQQRVPKPQYHPMAVRWCPVERSIRMH